MMIYAVAAVILSSAISLFFQCDLPSICYLIMLILAPDELMQRGLLLMKHTEERQARVNRDELLWRFKSYFGEHPSVFANLWVDLQTTHIPDARVDDATEGDLHKFLWAVHFLFSYKTEASMTGLTGWCDKTIRKNIWEYVQKIECLKADKIVWPNAWDDPGDNSTPIFLISVDGTHCPIFEPSNGRYSKNPKYYSHKFRKSGLAYEVAISIFTNQVVWINGPFPAGMGDPDIFVLGLKDKILPGKKVIADAVYNRIDLPMISLNNRADTLAVRLFKRRV